MSSRAGLHEREERDEQRLAHVEVAHGRRLAGRHVRSVGRRWRAHATLVATRPHVLVALSATLFRLVAMAGAFGCTDRRSLHAIAQAHGTLGTSLPVLC